MLVNWFNRINLMPLTLIIVFNCSGLLIAKEASEEVIYNTRNAVNRTINAIEIRRVDTDEQLFYRSVDVSPLNRNTWSLTSNWDIGAFSPDSGDPVPEEVEVRWRDLPRAGQALYRGDVKGPFRVKVRSMIPAEILKKSREPGFDLSLMFLVGKSPITFCWRLGDYASAPPNNLKVKVGGNCVQAAYIKGKNNKRLKEQAEVIPEPISLPVRENWSISNKVNLKIKKIRITIPNSKKSHYSPTVPEELEVSWQRTDQLKNHDNARFVGPYRIKVRSLISSQALNLVKDSYHYIVISIDTNIEPPTICWQLWDMTENPNGELKMEGGIC